MASSLVSCVEFFFIIAGHVAGWRERVFLLPGSFGEMWGQDTLEWSHLVRASTQDLINVYPTRVAVLPIFRVGSLKHRARGMFRHSTSVHVFPAVILKEMTRLLDDFALTEIEIPCLLGIQVFS